MTFPSESFGLSLPEYPWEALAPYRELAAQHPDGVADLSIGTPVDPTPSLIQEALTAGANAHGYPTVHGTPALREAVTAWFERRRGVAGLDPDAVLPTIGSKELVAALPFQLGLGPGDIVVRPKVAYPSYDIGAQLAGATAIAADDLDELDPITRGRVRMVWINSPGNPTGSVRDMASLKRIVDQAREQGAVVVSDECYAELGWDEWDEARGGQRVPSVLDPHVSGGDVSGLLAVYSLSKQSNLAGYRAAFAAGDPTIIKNLVNTRKHGGLIMPAPVQRAMQVALGDDEHVAAQKDLYRARREVLLPAVRSCGFEVQESKAGLYLWCTAGEDTWSSIGRLAERGILAGPGVFYGQLGEGFVRIALTAGDERITAAAQRLGV